MIEKFVQDLLAEKGLPEGVSEEVKAQLIQDLTSRVEDMINRRLIESLSEDQLAKFNAVLDKEPADQTAITQFIDENVKNKEEIVAAALLEFRALYLGPQ